WPFDSRPGWLPFNTASTTAHTATLPEIATAASSRTGSHTRTSCDRDSTSRSIEYGVRAAGDARGDKASGCSGPYTGITSASEPVAGIDPEYPVTPDIVEVVGDDHEMVTNVHMPVKVPQDE